MNDRTYGWNSWTTAQDLLDPLRTAWTSIRMRGAADGDRRERLVEPPRWSDAEILEQVERRLAEDEALRDSAIQVDAVYDGVVWLSGSAATTTAHARAFEDAVGVAGVRRVATEITTDSEVTTDDDAEDAAQDAA